MKCLIYICEREEAVRGFCQKCYNREMHSGGLELLQKRKPRYTHAARHGGNPRRRLKAQMRKHGLTEADMQRLLEAQDGRCGICRRKPADVKGGYLCVDHDHETGQVRGLLCSLCNLGIGNLDDDLERVLAAAEYLRRAALL